MGIRRFARLSPASAAAVVRNGGAGGGASIVAGLLLLRGNLAGAGTLAAVAASLGLFGRQRAARLGFWRRRFCAAAGPDHDSALGDDFCGSTRTPEPCQGVVLAGAQRGRELDSA